MAGRRDGITALVRFPASRSRGLGVWGRGPRGVEATEASGRCCVALEHGRVSAGGACCADHLATALLRHAQAVVDGAVDERLSAGPELSDALGRYGMAVVNVDPEGEAAWDADGLTGLLDEEDGLTAPGWRRPRMSRTWPSSCG